MMTAVAPPHPPSIDDVSSPRGSKSVREITTDRMAVSTNFNPIHFANFSTTPGEGPLLCSGADEMGSNATAGGWKRNSPVVGGAAAAKRDEMGSLTHCGADEAEEPPT